MKSTEAIQYHSPDLWKDIGHLVISPEMFEVRIESDLAFAQRIAGCTTIQLSHLAKGLNGQEVRVLQGNYDSGVECEIDRRVYKAIYGEDPHEEVGHFPKYVYSNRELAFRSITGELEKETMGREDFIDGVLQLDLFDFLQETTDVINAREREPDFDALRQIDVLDFYNYPEFNEALKGLVEEHFPETSDFIRFTNGFRRRKGVQVLFGDKERFADWVCGHSRYDYARHYDCGLLIDDSVPSELVMAVLPLGEDEQGAMLGV